MSEVSPNFRIITFCAWTVGFEARCRDFIASLLLRRMVNSCWGCLEHRLGGEDTRAGGEASLHTVSAKLTIVSFTGVVTSANKCSRSVCRVPRATVTLRGEGGVQGSVRPSARRLCHLLGRKVRPHAGLVRCLQWRKRSPLNQ